MNSNTPSRKDIFPSEHQPFESTSLPDGRDRASADRRQPSHERLACELVEAFAEGGGVRATLPAGRRAEFLDAVEAMMIDLDRLDRYVTALDAERKRRGIDGTLLRVPARELPVEDVADRGLATLSDDELADLAIRPVALGCLFQLLDERMTEGRVGTMWWDAVSRVVAEEARGLMRS